jgi:outer membrane protein TolC
LTGEARKQAEASRLSEEQTQVNLDRDYSKAVSYLESLREQQRLAEIDVKQSAESAQLYYRSYQAGKMNLIDVQAANNRALLSKVNAARISAQILDQLFDLQAISGEVHTHAE